jgi:hypothetical protein
VSKTPVLVSYWDLPPSPHAPSGMRQVLRVDNHHLKHQIIKHAVSKYITTVLLLFQGQITTQKTTHSLMKTNL